MTREERQRLQLPPWVGTLVALLGLLGATFGAWADNRAEVAVLQTQHAAMAQRITDLETDVKEAKKTALDAISATAKVSERTATGEANYAALSKLLDELAKQMERGFRRLERKL